MLLASLLLALVAADTASATRPVAYRIEARLTEADHVLAGRLQLVYRNQTPTALDTLWFHLHLNAFRPHSAWARRELEFGQRRFQDLGPDEHAYERVRDVVVAGIPVVPHYPGVPDSTVMAVPLPAPLAPGDSVLVALDWDARLATLPRRQGRRGRHYDFAQWYPRIAVHEDGAWQVQPLLPQGEFYGEFGSYDVSLELPADHVVGATGVPVEGDPGWAGAAAPGSPPPLLRRDAYEPRPAARLGLLADTAAAARRIVRWRAEDVHHFAWSSSPEFVYEGGAWRDIAVHVLYQQGDTAWGGGVVVERTVAALAFFDTIFGAYPWPQLTNLHRIEGGGTEFPMLVMNGSPSVGLILHEVGHNYLHGVLANNEWRDGWLDEGFVSYLTNWAHELAGRPVNWARDMAAIRERERLGYTQPIGLPGAEFEDPATYGAMTYTKAALVFRMLHWLVGDESFRAALRRYYADNTLSHVREADLRAAFHAVQPEPLDWFFDQWIHTTGRLDYRIGELDARRTDDGRWVARVEVLRDGEIWMPVDLQVGGTLLRLDARERRQVVELTMTEPPVEAVLDPAGILIDLNPYNNRRSFPQRP
jgi:hypothetical protein